MNNIPEFPKQIPLQIEHNHIIQTAAEAQGIRSADYSLYYLTSWYRNRPAFISRIDNRIVLDVEGLGGKHIFLGPFGTGALKESVEKLLHHAKKDFGEEPVLYFLPTALAEAIRSEIPPVREESCRNYFDYLYSREELAELTGSKFQKRRNQLNKFQRQNEAQVLPLKEEDTPQILECVDRWYDRYGNGDPFLDLERKSVNRALSNLWKLGGQGVRVKISEDLCGISWAVPITNDTWLVPVEKAVREISGMYQYVNWALANSLPSTVKVLNREADLGIEGLRIAKERYSPIAFEEKYTFWF